MIQVQTEMCMMLNISHERYSILLYKHGIAYLYWYLPCNQRQRRILEGSKTYWNWFKLQFMVQDQRMLDDPEFFDYTVEERRRYFTHLHDAQAMAVDIKPNSVVLAELNKKELVHV